MKKIFFITLAFVIAAETTRACDICGCGAGNSYIGILPEFNKHIFGIRYRYNFLQTHIGAGGTTTYLTTNETYRTLELWAGWNLGKKFRVMGSLPYNFNRKQTLTSTDTKNGTGDISFSGFYQLVSRRKAFNKKLLVQSLWLGTGIKLPTGKYETADKNPGTQSTNLFQLGTASTDFSFNAMYDVRLNDVGVNITSAYKINTKNRYGYQYGDRFSLISQLYYKFRIKKKLMLAPGAGIMYERSGKDKDKYFAVAVSGGHLLLATGGVEIAFRKIAAGMNFQAPLSQNLGAGFVKAKPRAMVHIAYTF